jgi:hypothetical protein
VRLHLLHLHLLLTKDDSLDDLILALVIPLPLHLSQLTQASSLVLVTQLAWLSCRARKRQPSSVLSVV